MASNEKRQTKHQLKRRIVRGFSDLPTDQQEAVRNVENLKHERWSRVNGQSEDIAQEFWLAVIRRLADGKVFEDLGHARAWAIMKFRGARAAVQAKHKRRGYTFTSGGRTFENTERFDRQPIVSGDQIEMEVAEEITRGSIPNVFRHIDDKDEFDFVVPIIAKVLSETEFRIFRLRRIKGWQGKEVAAHLNINRWNVTKSLVRSQKIIDDVFSNYSGR